VLARLVVRALTNLADALSSDLEERLTNVAASHRVDVSLTFLYIVCNLSF